MDTYIGTQSTFPNRIVFERREIDSGRRLCYPCSRHDDVPPQSRLAMTIPSNVVKKASVPGPSFVQMLLRFQSVFGLVGVLILSAALSPVRDGHILFLEPQNLLN